MASSNADGNATTNRANMLLATNPTNIGKTPFSLADPMSSEVNVGEAHYGTERSWPRSTEINTQHNTFNASGYGNIASTARDIHDDHAPSMIRGPQLAESPTHPAHQQFAQHHHNQMQQHHSMQIPFGDYVPTTLSSEVMPAQTDYLSQQLHQQTGLNPGLNHGSTMGFTSAEGYANVHMPAATMPLTTMPLTTIPDQPTMHPAIYNATGVVLGEVPTSPTASIREDKVPLSQSQKRKSKASKAMDEDAKRTRGRPRLDTQDETASDVRG